MKVEYSLHDSRLPDVEKRAQWAEAVGYDGISTGETKSEALFKLLLAAEHTQSISIATGVLIAFPRSPMVVAFQSWDIQDYSGGRLLLGLGTQVKAHNERRFSTPWVSPGPRLREYIGAVRAIWECWATGGKLNFEGDFYRFNLMTPYFTPPAISNPNIPIYISALNPYNLRLAGEICDGLRMHGFNTPKYTKDVILPNVEAGVKKAGRTLNDLDITGAGFYITGPNEEAIERQKRAVKSRIAFYGSTPAYKAVLEAHGWNDLHTELHGLSRQGKWDAMTDLISDDVLEGFTVMGTYDEIAHKIKATWGGISTRMGFEMPERGPEADEALKDILKELKA